MKLNRLALMKKYRQSINTLAITLLALVIITVAWRATHKPTATGQQKLAAVLTEVDKLYILPKDEKPTLATVEDQAKISDKFLSKHSKTGDKVLIYPKNHIVIIYRPSIHKIAAIGNVSGDPALSVAQGASLTVLDSINDPAKKATVISEIKAAYPTLKVTDGGSTSRKDFPYTIVIDRTDQKNTLRAALMKVVGGKQGFQPSSEAVQSTDLTIIIGQH